MNDLKFSAVNLSVSNVMQKIEDSGTLLFSNKEEEDRTHDEMILFAIELELALHKSYSFPYLSTKDVQDVVSNIKRRIN